MLLDENGFFSDFHQDKVFKLVLQVAQHGIVDPHPKDLADREVLAIADWFCEHCRILEKGDRPRISLILNINKEFRQLHMSYIFLQPWTQTGKAIKLALGNLLVKYTKLNGNPGNTKCAIRDTQYTIRSKIVPIFDTK